MSHSQRCLILFLFLFILRSSVLYNISKTEPYFTLDHDPSTMLKANKKSFRIWRIFFFLQSLGKIFSHVLTMQRVPQHVIGPQWFWAFTNHLRGCDGLLLCWLCLWVLGGELFQSIHDLHSPSGLGQFFVVFIYLPLYSLANAPEIPDLFCKGSLGLKATYRANV